MSFLFPPTIQTERLILRPFTYNDAPRVQELAGAPEIARMTLNIPHPYEDGMAEQWIATHHSTFFEKKGVVLAITLAKSSDLVGAIGLTAKPPHQRAEMGYWIGVPYWGNGYATEAAKALMAYGFETLNYHKIYAGHLKQNPASGRVMVKAGMVWEGEMVDHAFMDGQFHTLVYYGRVKGKTAVSP